jgi:predicted RNase H-like HicB family nuclease
MPRKVSVIIEKDEHGFYTWCPELRGCQSQADSLEQAISDAESAPLAAGFERLPSEGSHGARSSIPRS